MSMAATMTLPRLPGDVRMMNATARALAVLGIGLILASCGLWLAKQPLFVFRKVTIEGDVTRNSVATIRANAMPQLAGNFFSLDMARAKRAFESVPWVRQATVQRIWPDALRVRLVEHRAAALWIGEGGVEKLVNTYGEVFEANPGDVEDDELPTLQGPEGSSARLLTLHGALQPVFAAMNARIETLTLSTRGSLHADLDTGAEVEIGRGTDDELVARARRFVDTLPQVIAQHGRKLVRADLRHNDGYAVRLQGISTTLTPAELAGRK